MTSVPMIIHLGDSQLAGPITSATTGFGQYTGLPFLFSSFAALPKLMLAVPHEADGGLPNWGAAEFYPWWEGHAATGAGLFLPYHHIPGVFPTSGGSVWYGAGNDTGAPGVGSDAIYMHGFHEMFSADPWFKCFKFGSSAGGYGNAAGWKASVGTALLAAGVEYLRAVADMANNSYEPDVRLIILDASAWDIEHWADAGVGSAYYNNLLGTILDVRNRFSAPNAKIILISHSPELWQATSPGAALLARELERALVVAGAGQIAVVDMIGSAFAPLTFGSGADLPGYDKKFYAIEAYLAQGARIVAQYDRMVNPVATVPGIGMPVYFLIGDSQAVGGVPAYYTLLSRQGSILGPGPGPVGTRPGQWIWNDQTQAIENYHPLSNSNTAGTVIGSAGPDITLMDELSEDHPDGFLLIKFGQSGSAVADARGGLNPLWRKTANDRYQVFLTMAKKALLAVSLQTGIERIPDMRGGFIILGDNDAYTTPTEFPAQLPVLFADLRSDLTTRTDGEPLALVFCRVVPVSTLGEVGLRAQVHAAAATIAAADLNSRYVDTDDIELSRDDGIHWGNEGVFWSGREMVRLMREILAQQAASDSADAGDEDEGAVVAASQPSDLIRAIEQSIGEAPDVGAYTIDGDTVQLRSLRDQIEAHKYLTGVAQKRSGIRRTRVSFERGVE